MIYHNYISSHGTIQCEIRQEMEPNYQSVFNLLNNSISTQGNGIYNHQWQSGEIKSRLCTAEPNYPINNRMIYYPLNQISTLNHSTLFIDMEGQIVTW